MHQLANHPGWAVLRRIAGLALQESCGIRDPGDYKDYAHQRPFYDGMLEWNAQIKRLVDAGVARHEADKTKLREAEAEEARAQVAGGR